MEISDVVEDTRHWVKSLVIGLGLCPFAERVFKADTIRFTVCESTDPADLLTFLSQELRLLASAPRFEIETTLLIHPHVLSDFLDFNDFLGIVEEMVSDLQMEGVIQVVGFHPAFQFTETSPEAPENYTNRSPYPMLHLLREESISEVSGNADELSEIPRRNIQTLRRLGTAGILERLKGL